MSELFAASALRLAGAVPRLLGWQPQHFWQATPAELAAILTDGQPPEAAPLSRGEMQQLMERERHG